MSSPTYQINKTITTINAQSLTDLGFTVAQLAAAKVAWITPADSALRYRVDGTDPTSSAGEIFDVDRTTEFDTHRRGNLTALNLIAKDASADVTISIQ